MIIPKQKKPVSKSYILYDFNDMIFLEMQTFGSIKGINDLQCWGGCSRQSKEDVQLRENILHDTMLMDLYHDTLVQTHRMYNTKTEP